MQSSELADDVRNFLRDRIESFEHLEILLLLRSERDRVWDVGSLNARLRIPETLIQTALGGLIASGLVRSHSQGKHDQYAYAIEAGLIDTLIGRLETTYREQPLQIIREMSGNAIERVRTSALRVFADAFILRKDTRRG